MWQEQTLTVVDCVSVELVNTEWIQEPQESGPNESQGRHTQLSFQLCLWKPKSDRGLLWKRPGWQDRKVRTGHGLPWGGICWSTKEKIATNSENENGRWPKKEKNHFAFKFTICALLHLELSWSTCGQCSVCWTCLRRYWANAVIAFSIRDCRYDLSRIHFLKAFGSKLLMCSLTPP